MVPVNKNEEYEVKITGISSDGNGVGHINGFTVFVPGTADGDVARVRITYVKPRFCYAEMAELMRPSPDRTEPKCKSFGNCGGCSLQHIEYGAQLSEKKKIIENAMRRIGGFKDFTIGEFIGAKNPYGYRNKMVFRGGYDDNGRSVLGFFEPKSHRVTEVTDCALCGKINMDILDAVKRYASDFSVPVYDEKTNTGTLKQVFIRNAKATSEVMIEVTFSKMPPNPDALAARLKNVSDNIVSVHIVSERGDKRLVYGRDYIEDVLCGVRFKISPQSFYQVNPEQTEILYNKALEFLSPSPNDTVMDIYCGIGTISLCAAKRAGKVIGVEIVGRAVDDARGNARINGIKNAEFFAGSAADVVPRLISRGVKPDAVILDPPRAGSDEKTLSAIVSAKPEKIIYVSCNPATLARDTKFLSENGYAVTASAAVDMFPQTPHVETVVLMSKVKE